MKRTSIFLLALILVAATSGLVTAVGSDGEAGLYAVDDGLRVKEKTKFTNPSAGSTARFLGKIVGMPDEIETVTSVNGTATKKRIDEKDESTIIDLENEVIVELDHKKKTATVTTFDELRARYEELQRQLEEGAQEGETTEPEPDDDEPDPENRVTVTMSLESTGRVGKHRGFKTEEFHQTIQAKNASGEGGDLVTFTEMQVTDEIDLSLIEKFDKAYVEALGDAFYLAGDLTQTIEALFDDPAMQEAFSGFQEAQEELGDRTPVYTKTAIVTVPPDEEFDPELVFAEKKKKGGGFGGFARRAIGREEEEEEEADQEQTTTFIIESDYSDYKRTTHKEKTFEVPSNYKVRDQG